MSALKFNHIAVRSGVDVMDNHSNFLCTVPVIEENLPKLVVNNFDTLRTNAIDENFEHNREAFYGFRKPNRKKINLKQLLIRIRDNLR